MEDEGLGDVAWIVDADDKIREIEPSGTGVSQRNKRLRGFSSLDRIFDSAASNDLVYEEFCRPIALDAMRGYHTAILAYGQTGTGKTYTMQGTPSSPGIIPRAIEECFAYIEEEADNEEREYALRVSYLEVYNEKLRDLLAPLPKTAQSRKKNSTTTRRHRPSMHTQENEEEVRLLEDPRTGTTRVVGCVETSVATIADVYDLVVQGESLRQIGETSANARSSRSHAILRLTIESSKATHSYKKETLLATLSFCDLAGSERSTAPRGSERAQESGYINRSLHALAHVVAKLAAQQYAHVPYRDSKLTRLLRPALGGNARVALVCTCSPTDIDETANTLLFATRAKRVTQVATRNAVLDTESQLAAYKQQVTELKLRLAQLEQDQHHKAVPTPQPSSTEHIGSRADERQALSTAVEHLERLILRSGSPVTVKTHVINEEESTHEEEMNTLPAKLEPRFFGSATASRQGFHKRRGHRRSATLPPRPLEADRADALRDLKGLLHRGAVLCASTDDLSLTDTSHQLIKNGGMEPLFEEEEDAVIMNDNSNVKSQAAAAVLPIPPTPPPNGNGSSDAIDGVAPQLLRIKAAIEQVLASSEHSNGAPPDSFQQQNNDASEVIKLKQALDKARDDSAFLLQQLDSTQAENKRLRAQLYHVSEVLRSREAELFQLKGIDGNDETF